MKPVVVGVDFNPEIICIVIYLGFTAYRPTQNGKQNNKFE
jgi:hypothetical protein